MEIELVNVDKQEALEEVLATNLLEYRPEIDACIHIRQLSHADVEAVKLRTERFLNNINEVLEEW